MTYDLIVVGNGLAAQTFLFELFNQQRKDVKSQNFSVAQIFSEEIAPSCSLRTTATVSLSGIEEGVSALGDHLRESFFLFLEFVKKHSPQGVEAVNQYITFSSDDEREKLLRRYKKLDVLNDPLFRSEKHGVTLSSYLIAPELFSGWFEDHLQNENLTRIKNFVRSIDKNADGVIECSLMDGKVIKGSKIVVCSGAFGRIFSHFFKENFDLSKTQVVAGSFLERVIDLKRPSFYVTMDSHNLIYRSEEKKLILGSASKKGAFGTLDHRELSDMLELFNESMSIDLGKFSDFSIKTGQRHKGAKRHPIFRAVDQDKKIYLINGFYKNGFTFCHLGAKTVLNDLFKALEINDSK